MQEAAVQSLKEQRQRSERGFCAFKVRPGASEEKDGFVRGLRLADLQDGSRFPSGTQSDEKGEFVWGCELDAEGV